MNIHHAPHHGASIEWETPPEILAALGQFDDDPARAGLTDGLTRAWRGLVWLNPPYGPEIGQWLAKLAEHGSGVALIFARTETRWFVEFVWSFASALLFLHGRPHFYRDGVRAKGNSGGPLVLVSYGIEAQRRLEKCGLLGTLITDWNRP